MVRRSLFYFFDSLLLGLCQMVLVKKKSEEIDDETLSPEVSSSISPRPPPLLPAARKGLRLGFGEQNLHTGRRRKSPYRRRAGRRLCSPPPAKAYCFVSGSKKFTHGGGGKRFITGSQAADFAPRCPERLTAPFRGAKSSHKAAAKIALSPARRPPPLLPAARKGLRLRIGEQKVHTRRRRKTLYCRRESHSFGAGKRGGSKK